MIWFLIGLIVVASIADDIGDIADDFASIYGKHTYAACLLITALIIIVSITWIPNMILRTMTECLVRNTTIISEEEYIKKSETEIAELRISNTDKVPYYVYVLGGKLEKKDAVTTTVKETERKNSYLCTYRAKVRIKSPLSIAVSIYRPDIEMTDEKEVLEVPIGTIDILIRNEEEEGYEKEKRRNSCNIYEK